MTIPQTITSLLISGKATWIKIGGISRHTTKQRSPSGRTWGNSKRVGTREFVPPSFNPPCWKPSCDRVEVQIASITGFLPSSDNIKGEYSGTVHGPGIPSFLTPLQESELRRKQTEAQIRDAENRKVFFDADPSPDAEITSEVIDPEGPLGIMDNEGNIVTNPTGSSTTVGRSGQRPIPKERVIDAGHAEKHITDVRELVGALLQSRFIVVTLPQAFSSHEAGIEKTQALPPTQPMSIEGIEEGLDPVLMTQAPTLAGISHGVETQILKKMFDSLPPSSQPIESEMLGSSVSRIRIEYDLIRFHRP